MTQVIKIIFEVGVVSNNLRVLEIQTTDVKTAGFYWQDVFSGPPSMIDATFGPFPNLYDAMRHYSNLSRAMRRQPAVWPIQTNNVIHVDFKEIL